MASFDFVPLTLHYAQDERWKRASAKHPTTGRKVGEASATYPATGRKVEEAFRDVSPNRSS